MSQTVDRPDELLAPIEENRQEVDDLQRRVDILEERLNDLEESDATPNGALDHYDATVLDRMEVGQTYTLQDLRSAYKSAGIRQKNTLKERIRHLTTTYFDQLGRQRWEFLGRSEQ